ncbi:MAG: fructosamine kinase family protein [Hyphomicrobiales bacterium]|nr:fructosamine kinase family protein [Hyphomicrobiales bacterium]
MRAGLERAVAAAAGDRPVRFAALGGGCIGDVYRVDLAGGGAVVAKVGDGDAGLDLEGYMLDYLATHSRLPVPRVLHAEAGLLVMTHIEAGGGLDTAAQEDAADLLADLHGITADRYGLARDTLIGGLPQPNPWTADWRDFFRDHRLLYMAGLARDAGRLPGRVYDRVARLAARLERWIADPGPPSLLHGDMWTGNVLCRRGRIAGFVDPAVYYGDAEVELAFSTLFGTFGDPFFRRYAALRPLAPGFFEERRDLYNLYPLLVHVRLFGGSYLGSVERTLSRFGC